MSLQTSFALIQESPWGVLGDWGTVLQCQWLVFLCGCFKIWFGNVMMLEGAASITIGEKLCLVTRAPRGSINKEVTPALWLQNIPRRNIQRHSGVVPWKQGRWSWPAILPVCSFLRFLFVPQWHRIFFYSSPSSLYIFLFLQHHNHVNKSTFWVS